VKRQFMVNYNKESYWARGNIKRWGHKLKRPNGMDEESTPDRKICGGEKHKGGRGVGKGL